MSATNREVAHRVFAAEYDDATYSYSESDEERAPNYVVTPTGARVNRVFLVGVLTEVEQVGDDVLRARVADPTGAFVVYAGQYQPDEMAFLEEAEPPLFVAVTGKARTFSPEGSDRVFTSVRPESINEVDAETRDRWTVQAAEHTLGRVATFAAALDLDAEGDALRAALAESGVDAGLAAGIPVAVEQYGTTEHYLAAIEALAVDALELVAGAADEVPAPDVAPADAGSGTVDADALGAAVDGAVVDLTVPEEPDAERLEAAAGAGGGPETTTAGAAGADADPEAADDGATGERSASGDAEAPAGEAVATESAGTDGEAATPEADAGELEAADSEDLEDLGDFEPGGGSGGDGTVEDAGGVGDAGDAGTDGDAAAAEEPPEDVLDEEERERIEAEYGTDFSTGAEVDEPGEADIEPEAGSVDSGGEGDGAGTGAEATPETETESEDSEPEEAVDKEPETTAEAGATAEPDDPGAGDDTAEPEADVDEEPEADVDEELGADTAADESGEADGAEVDLEGAVMDAMADLDDGEGADREELVAVVVDEHGVDPGAVEDAIQDALMAGKCYEPDDEHVKPI